MKIRVGPPNYRKISKAQAEYLEILFNDLIFSLKQRNDYLATRYGKRFVDELTIGEASEVIFDLKRLKDDKM